MKPPKSIHIFGQKYVLKPDSRLSSRHLDGEYCKESHTITYDPKLKGDRLTETILHEMFHAVFQEVSLAQAITPEIEEICVDTLAKAIAKNFTLTSKK